MKLKDLYRRFRAWQQEPYRYEAPAGEEHICKNCGHSFQGKFCPVCGQKATIGRVSWKSVWTDFLSIWVTDSRSAVPSLLQLLGRPGFLIRDYLSGRRKVSYSPVSMLFLLALVVVVLRQLMSAGEGGVDLAISADPDDNLEWFIFARNWLKDNPAWSLLLYTAFMVIPTHLLFRHAPRYPHHSLPEGIYIQIFMSCLLAFFLVVSLFWEGAFMLNFLYYVIVYRQLFGFSFLGTLWRVPMCIGSAFIMGLAFIIGIGFVVFDSFQYTGSLWVPLLFVSFVIGFILLMLYLFGLFGRKRT